MTTLVFKFDEGDFVKATGPKIGAELEVSADDAFTPDEVLEVTALCASGGKKLLALSHKGEGKEFVGWYSEEDVVLFEADKTEPPILTDDSPGLSL